MSFRIDDILKREESPKSNRENTPSPPRDTKTEVPYGLNQDSILQQTLLNRHMQYYRPSVDYTNLRLLPNSYCDKMYMPYGHYDQCLDKVSAFSSVYSRSRFWPMYPHPVVFPLPYTHYSKRKGGQVRFTASQTDALEKRFSSHKYLSPEDRRVLADSLKLSDRQVKTWFQNRRAKWRRCNSISSNSQMEQNEDESESDPEICDDTPDHEKTESSVK